MKHTKEQLEQALKFIEAKMGQDYMTSEDYYHIWKYHGETIQSLIQDALDPWNYNMDEAPRDGTYILVSDGQSVDQVMWDMFDKYFRATGGKADCGNFLDYEPDRWMNMPTP